MKKAESDVNTQQKVLDNKEKIANIIQNAKKIRMDSIRHILQNKLKKFLIN